MDDKPQNLSATPDLAAAIRQARVENAERGEAVADLREIELGRLGLLEGALKPVVEQAPPEADIFDLALARGDHPRLFIDMIAFVDMGHDRRTYRFCQDTRHGRVVIAESQSTEAIAAAVATYVARRLVERERALASDWRDAQAPRDHSVPREPEDRGPRAWPLASGREGTALASSPAASEAIEPVPADWAPARRGFLRGLGDFLSVFLMMLGSITLALMIALGLYLVWTMRLRDLWAQWTGAPPF